MNTIPKYPLIPSMRPLVRWKVRPHCLKLSSLNRKFSTSLTTLSQPLQGKTVYRHGFWELLRRLCQGRSPHCSISHCPGSWYQSNGKRAWSRQWPRFHVLPLAQISVSYQWLPYYPGFWRRWSYALSFTPYLIILCTQISLVISSPSGQLVPQLVPLSISFIFWLTFYKHTLTSPYCFGLLQNIRYCSPLNLAGQVSSIPNPGLFVQLAGSVLGRITASIVQGSGIGPTAFVLTASDLRALSLLIFLNKYTDDCYIIVPPDQASLISTEQALKHRRLLTDLLTCYNIVHGFFSLTFDNFFTLAANRFNTRGHVLKLTIPLDKAYIRKYFFSSRVIKPWNSLPEEFVTSDNSNSFKSKISSYDFSNFLIFPCLC